MSTRSDAGSRLLHWSMTLGGGLCLLLGVLVLMKSQMSPIPRSAVFLAGVSGTSLGLGLLLEPDHPELAAPLKFVGKLFAGFAIFSLSWGVSHGS